MRTHVDLMETLGQIVAENTRYFQSDFDMDLRRLTWAAMEPKREDRCFYWMSRPLGTWCVREREVFLPGHGRPPDLDLLPKRSRRHPGLPGGSHRRGGRQAAGKCAALFLPAPGAAPPTGSTAHGGGGSDLFQWVCLSGPVRGSKTLPACAAKPAWRGGKAPLSPPGGTGLAEIHPPGTPDTRGIGEAAPAIPAACPQSVKGTGQGCALSQQVRHLCHKCPHS